MIALSIDNFPNYTQIQIGGLDLPFVVIYLNNVFINYYIKWTLIMEKPNLPFLFQLI